MFVWSSAPVSEEPEVTLTRWQVFELPDGARHLVGWYAAAREGRVSSRIERYDAASRSAVTRSGRVYELAGRPGSDADARYTWRAWSRVNGVSEYKDVTAAVWAEFCANASSAAPS